MDLPIPDFIRMCFFYYKNINMKQMIWIIWCKI